MNTDNKKIRESALEWFNELSKTKAYWVAVCKSQNVLISESEIIEMYLSEHPQETKEKSTAVIEGLEDAAKNHADDFYDENDYSEMSISEHDKWENRKYNFIDGAQWLHDTRYKPLSELLGEFVGIAQTVKFWFDNEANYPKGCAGNRLKNEAENLIEKANKFINK